MNAPTTMAELRDPGSARIFPQEVLKGCRSALVLFAAAFHGRQDAIWIADAGLRATCVDIDHAKLGDMGRVYPEGWEFVNGDVFDYAALTTRKWDLVTLDPPTNLFEKCAAWLPRWCELARRAVVLGCGPSPELDVPDGWALEPLRYRSDFAGGVNWAVLVRT